MASHPAVLAAQRDTLSERIADKVTAFAGSMAFVYVHVVAFMGWMIIVEGNPWPSLTLVVSLEAIFLATFVLIGQNRQARFAQLKADHDYQTEYQLLVENTELIREIHKLVKDAAA